MLQNVIELFERAKEFEDRIAIIDTEDKYTYKTLIDGSANIAAGLLEDKNDLQEERIAFLTPQGFPYVITQWGIWKAGGIAVPLSSRHPRPELEHVLTDSGTSKIVTHPEFEQKLKPIAEDLGIPLFLTTDLLKRPKKILPQVSPSRRALMLYTSGTTNKPKGVVTTHSNIQSQITSLVSAWEWTQDDHILHVLPLNHIHGVINVLCCGMWSGAACEMLPVFDSEVVWQRFRDSPINIFMAVPTIYVKLIKAWEKASPEQQIVMSESCKKFRFMVSGSAALPVSVLQRWEEISGHKLLERYGMTEIGMGLSNPLKGERVPGHVGSPLPNVELKLVDERGNDVEDGNSGEIVVRGPNVFLEYWEKPEVTKNAFRDGWFLTGDIAVREKGIFRILGRNSVDIIKNGGYKISALEIEEVLRTHPIISECAVVGIEDIEWGQRVAAAVILEKDHTLSLEELRSWAKERLNIYKVPTLLINVEDLPRNGIGKVMKPKVVALFSNS